MARWGVGIVIPGDLTNNEATGHFQGIPARGTRINDLELSPGAAIGAKLGYFFQAVRWVGLEAEVFASRPELKNQPFNGSGGFIFIRGTTTEGHARVIAPALNIIIRYPGARFQPYIGAGPALAIIKVFDDGGTSSRLGISALAGVRLLVTNHLGLFAEYKYLRASYESDHAITQTLGVKGDYSANHLVVGASYHF